MEEDTDFKKIPVDERCVHKLWKARVDGYEEAAKIFRSIEDDKSPEWNKYLGLIKKFVTDSNAAAQEKGMEAALVFIENCGNAGKTVGEVMSGIISKCIGATRTKTRELAIQITLMYVEIEKHETVIEELLKGTEQKNPKISSACVSALTLSLKEFGNKVIGVKSIVKKLPVLFSDRDKTVRDESKLLTIEIYRWIGAAFIPQISAPAVLLAELQTEFDKIQVGKAIPTRYLKSQQEKQMLIVAQSEDAEETDDIDDQQVAEDIDPMDFIDPVDILSKMPKDFYEKLEAKKWQERKESLDALEVLLQNPKLQPGDYGDVVRALKKVITKDSNVVLVALAGKCLAGVAKGIDKKFQPYASACVPAIFEKFKEKKANVVTALRDAIDAIYPSTNLEAIQEDVIEALNNKNPSVKAETISFLTRAFCKTLPTVLNKKLLKTYITALLKTLNEPDPTVRDVSAEAIGTAMKLVGEKTISPLLTEVDPIKMTKIKECCDKAVITVKIPAAKKERPITAPPKIVAAPGAKKKAGSTEPKPVVRPNTAVKKTGTAGKKPASTGGLAKSSSTQKMLPTERDMSQDEVDEKALELLTAETINGLVDANWKTRLSSAETFSNALNDFDSTAGHCQVLIRTIAKKPGLKDTNFQVLKIKLEIIKAIVEKFGITTITADYIMNEITEKLGDAKNGPQAVNALTAIAEAIRLEYVVSKVIEFAFEQKSPKVQQESLQWVNNAIREFGFQVNPKVLIEDAKKCVQTINPAVRSAAISLLGTMYLYMGNSLMVFFENEKPALKQQIQTEIDKHIGEKPPPIIRGVVKSASKGSMSDVEEDEEAEPAPMININDLIPRVDISPQITEALLTEMSDKNWKTRNEGLIKVQNMLNENKLIKSTLGDLPQILAQRLVDSNAKIAQTALEICQQLAVAIGPPCKIHVRTLFPGFLRGLGDGKAFIRSACITCINTWGDECGYKEFFESEMIGDALKSGSPALKTEVWGWLSEKLPPLPPKSVPKDELIAILPHLYANICDRNADVRKNANEAVLGIMIHIGYEAMMKAMDKQKPASKKDLQAALDKARPNLPLKPLPKNKQQAPIIDEPKSIKTGAGKIPKPGTASKIAAPAQSTNRKKEEDVDTSPLLSTNNLKNQRLLDEQKLKVLKWTFTTPREEFTDLLKEQMQTANVNRGLMANMFHDDFRYHLKVIDSLIEDLPNNEKSLICNLDLILKWLSLRFYDTNPSVLLKSLDYLNLVFQMLVRNTHYLAENEGASFIPHLLIKIGDPKDAVRNGVRSLLREICLVYPFTKVFIFVMDALKSKNARQRAECLDELGYLIESYKLPVCQPTPQHALKEIAKHISDRDNAVRNAALNCIVQAYFLVDDKIYKYIGQMNEKDLSMLDERIKRSKRPVKPVTPVIAQVKAVQQVEDVQEIEIMDVTTEEELPPVEEIESNPNLTRITNSSDGSSNYSNETIIIMNSDYEGIALHDEFQQDHVPSTLNQSFNSSNSSLLVRPKITGPFGLDPEVITDIEKDWIRSEAMKEFDLKTIDTGFMSEPIKVSAKGTGSLYPDDKFKQLLNKKEKTMNGSPNNMNISPAQAKPPSYVFKPTQRTNIVDVKLDPNLLRIIKNIGCQDVFTAHAAIIELTDILESPEKQAVLRDYEELYIQNILQQFKHLSHKSFNDSLIMYNPLLQSLFLFYNSKSLGKNLSLFNVKSIISVLLGLLADNKLGNGEDTQHTKVVNGICLKAMDRTNFTTINCALINLLKEACSNSGLPKFTDLLMKCIWRNVKVMPKRINELDYDAVLLEIHEFMSALPSTWWSNRPSDTPMRTVKTIIHNMTKIKGNAILENVKKIPSYSELHSYILKILNNLQKDTSKPSVQETLSGIFKLIADKESNQEGLNRLHEFKHKNQDVDIHSYIKTSKQSFQDYILDSLKELDKTKSYDDVHTRTETHIGMNNIQKTHNNVHNSSPSINSSHPISQDEKCNPEYWMDKLNSMKSKFSLMNRNENSVSNLLDNRASEENITLTQIQPKLTLLRKENNEQPISANRRDILQQKLDQIKQHKLN